jgi:ubiquinone/menaquinone biosynthesis C-methylase UbiE
METGRFNTNAAALKQRIQAHEKYALHDLNQWIFDHVELAEGLSILDLGCGTGKQTLPLAQLVGDSGHVLAVDISQEALDILSLNAKELGLEERITLLRIGLDELGEHLHKELFDRILACYSLYYVKYPRNVFDIIHHILKPGGIFFFCGPTKDNNSELKQVHYALMRKKSPPTTGAAVFMEETGQQLAREFFTKVEVFSFENPLRFNSAEALYGYWSSYNLFDEKLDVEFKAAADNYFRHHSVFETIKRANGVRVVKLSVHQH